MSRPYPDKDVTASSEWFVWRFSVAVPEDPYVKWAGPFKTKAAADEWLEKQGGWPAGMRLGRSAILWV